MQIFDKILLTSLILLAMGLITNRIQRQVALGAKAVIWSLLFSVLAGVGLATGSVAILFGADMAIAVAILFLSALAFPLAGTVEKLLDLFGNVELLAKIKSIGELMR